MQIKTRTKVKDAGYDLGAGAGDTVPNAIGKGWCDVGWVEDVTGQYPSAARRTEAVTIEPHNALTKGVTRG